MKETLEILENEAKCMIPEHYDAWRKKIGPPGRLMMGGFASRLLPLAKTVGGITFVGERCDLRPDALRMVADLVRVRMESAGVVCLLGVSSKVDNGGVVIAVTKDLAKHTAAGALASRLAPLIGGQPTDAREVAYVAAGTPQALTIVDSHEDKAAYLKRAAELAAELYPAKRTTMLTLQTLFEEHVGVVQARQLALVAGAGGRFDIDFGSVPWRLTLRGRDFSARLIGQATPTHWMWGWDAPNTPDALIAGVRKVRELGEKNGIPELTNPRVEIGRIKAHVAATIAAGVLNAPNYYLCPGSGMTLVVTVDTPIEPKATPPLAGELFAHLVKTNDEDMRFDVRRAFLRYLDRTKTRYEISGADIIVNEADRMTCTITPTVDGKLPH